MTLILAPALIASDAQVCRSSCGLSPGTPIAFALAGHGWRPQDYELLSGYCGAIEKWVVLASELLGVAVVNGEALSALLAMTARGPDLSGAVTATGQLRWREKTPCTRTKLRSCNQ